MVLQNFNTLFHCPPFLPWMSSLSRPLYHWSLLAPCLNCDKLSGLFCSLSFISTKSCLSFCKISIHISCPIVLLLSNMAWYSPPKCRRLHRAAFNSFPLGSCPSPEAGQDFSLGRVSQDTTSWIASSTSHYFPQGIAFSKACEMGNVEETVLGIEQSLVATNICYAESEL